MEKKLPKIIYGDGVHDDTEAVQAAVRGEPVEWPDGTPFGGMGWEPGTFKVSATIVLDRNPR